MNIFPRIAKLEPKKPDPFEDEAEVVAGGGEDGVDGVALFVSEVVSLHAVAVLEVSDDRLDGGAAFHEALDCWGDAAFLPRCEDAQFVDTGRIVAPLAGIGEDPLQGRAGQRLDLGDHRCQGVAIVRSARQRLGVNRELAALAAL